MPTEQDQTDVKTAATVDDDKQAIWNDLVKAEDAPAPKEEGEPEAGKPVGEKEKDEKATGAETPAADIWANASPEQKTAFEEQQRKLQQTEEEMRRHRGRHSKLAKTYPEIFGQDGDVKPRSAEWKAPVKGERKKLSSVVSEALKPIKPEFPEIAAPIEAAVNALTEQVEAAQDRFDRMDRKEQQAELVANETRLTELQPDWLEVSRQPEFHAWIAKQPAHRQSLIEANGKDIVDPEAAAEVFAWFKTDQAATATANTADPKKGSSPNPGAKPDDPKRALQRAGASQPRVNGPQAAAPGIPDDGDPGEIWNAMRREEESKRARRTA